MRRENAGFKQEQDAFVRKTLVVKKMQTPLKPFSQLLFREERPKAQEDMDGQQNEASQAA